MLYSTCIWETGTVKVFDLIGNIIPRVSTTNWWESKIDSMYIGEGGALNRCLKMNKQSIKVFGETYQAGRELRLTRRSADVCQLQKLHLTSNMLFYTAFINIEKYSR